MTYSILIWLLQILLVPLISPACIGLTRKIKAKFQNRQGASIFQPYRELDKLSGKDEVISEDASWIFRAAPYLLFSVSVVIAASIPLVTNFLPDAFASDFLVIIFLFALSTFFLALAGMDVGSAFGGFGSSREMMVAALAEGGMVLSILTLALVSQTSNLFEISRAVARLPVIDLAPVILAFVSFLIVMLAENKRYPFDNPSTHLELTMIHEAMILEYSGKRLALVEWASANKYLIFMALGANLFLPWGLSATLAPAALLAAIAIFGIKIACFSAFVAVVESSIAKLRIFRLPDLLFSAIVIGMIAIGSII